MPETTERISSETHALVMDNRDTVAVAIRDLAAGETVAVTLPDGTRQSVTLADPIPFGHKFALVPMATGAQVMKYGEHIARTTADIAVGQHVHVHNATSQRGRGDLLKSAETDEPNIR